MKEMYKGMVNSPQTKIDQAINAADTDIRVKDGTAFPKGPNLAVIGTDKSAETILYSSVNNNILVGCTRGYQGAARNWDVNTPIARNFTEADLNAVQENIRTLDGKTLADISDDESHRTVSDDEKSSWNNKVDKVDGKVLSTNDFTDAAKKKVDAIPPDPKYTDTIQDLSDYVKKTNLLTKLADMVDDTNHRLVTDEEKKAWNEKPDDMDLKNATNVFYVTTNSTYSYNTQFYEYFKLNNSPIITFNIPKDRPIQGNFGPPVSGEGFLIRIYNSDTDAVFCFAMVQTQENFTSPEFRMYLVLLGKNSNDNVWMPMDLDLFYQSVDMSKSGGSKNDNMVNVLNDISSKVNQLTRLSSKVNSMKEQVILTQSEYDALSGSQKNDSSKIYFIREA